jgi:hypothetical protein
VHSWKKNTVDPRIELGPYSERIREWLVGNGKYPERTHLIVIVEQPEMAQITINDPYEGVREGHRRFFVHVPGILFMLPLGAMVDESIRALAIANAGNPINISEKLTRDFEQLTVRTLRNSRKTEAFLRAKAKADADRK